MSVNVIGLLFNNIMNLLYNAPYDFIEGYLERAWAAGPENSINTHIQFCGNNKIKQYSWSDFLHQ